MPDADFTAAWHHRRRQMRHDIDLRCFAKNNGAAISMCSCIAFDEVKWRLTLHWPIKATFHEIRGLSLETAGMLFSGNSLTP